MHRLNEGFGCFVRTGLRGGVHLRSLFNRSLGVLGVYGRLDTVCGVPIITKGALVFLSRVRMYPHTVITLHCFCRRVPSLRIITTNSLLRFTLGRLPSFKIKHVRSLFVCPFDFSRFLLTRNDSTLLTVGGTTSTRGPVARLLRSRLIGRLHSFCLINKVPRSITT